jgi:hypothetical protein
VSRPDDIAFRLLCIGVRRFSAEPAVRESAAMLMLRNALRLCLSLFPRAEVGKVILQVLSEPSSRGREAA